MQLSDLRQEWEQVTGGKPPPVSAALLRLAIGYELQTRALGGPSAATEKRLKAAAAPAKRSIVVHPGSRLVREWQGTVHIVTIAEDGTILWNGKNWRSLSEVACAITGTRWSGPAFFGLRQKVAAA
jgi:hypothetical protein